MPVGNFSAALVAHFSILVYNSQGDVTLKERIFIDVQTVDAAWNLALEEYVFEHMPRDREYLLLWRNANAIIVGRHQNTLAEINDSFVRSRDIQVVRRLSGGGAVYHDLGNLNFTFITDALPGQQVDLGRFCRPVAAALCALGANASVSGRNDILIDDRKVSGNAQYVRQGRVMHHGTLLFDPDLSVLGQALLVDPAKIRAKGVQSVRSRVTSIKDHLDKDLTMEEFKEALLSQLLKDMPFERYELTAQDMAAVERLRAERYATWDWNYGASSECTLVRKARFEGCGTVEAHITLDGSRIKDLIFRGDYFSTLEPENLACRLLDQPLEPETLEEVLAPICVQSYFTGLSAENLIDLLCGHY